MNIDSLPLTAFALEASGAAARAVGSVHTLTLKTAGAPDAVATIPAPGCVDGRSISVLPASPAPVLVLTF